MRPGLASLASLAALSAAVLIAAAPARSEPSLPEGVRGIDLIEGWRQADGTHVAALEVRLAPGWHTYWRVPGEAGIPPRLDWSRSRNLASVRYEWPRPRVFDFAGLRTIGYADTLVLPVILTPERPGEPIDIDLDLLLGVCADICVPAEARLGANLAPDAPASGRPEIEAARADRPRSAAEAGVTSVTCRLVPGAAGMDLDTTVSFAAPPGADQVAVLEPGGPGLRIGPAESRTEGRAVHAKARIKGRGGAGPVLDRGALRLTLLDGSRAVDIRGCAAPR
ncbi:MAG: hypothetical protein KDJ83_11355 [Rhodobacteraceae bacterium]|nr:hypothetical protein [Paracoccaceae bacterium]